MLYLIDVGNTSASYGFYEEGRLQQVGHTSSERIPIIASKMIENSVNGPIMDVVFTSVVPKITRKIRNSSIKKRIIGHIWVVGENLKVQIRHKYRNIKKLGSDRLVNIFGASRLYRPPLLILDYGTALTCDFISKEDMFLGGLIVPGPEIAFNALCERAALLPKITFPKRYGSFMGRDTKGGLMAGILQGYGAMTDGLVERFRSRYGRKFQVIASGGLASVIHPYTSRIDVLDPLLTLKSLVEVYKDTVKRRY